MNVVDFSEHYQLQISSPTELTTMHHSLAVLPQWKTDNKWAQESSFDFIRWSHSKLFHSLSNGSVRATVLWAAHWLLSVALLLFISISYKTFWLRSFDESKPNLECGQFHLKWYKHERIIAFKRFSWNGCKWVKTSFCSWSNCYSFSWIRRPSGCQTLLRRQSQPIARIDHGFIPAIAIAELFTYNRRRSLAIECNSYYYLHSWS